MNGERGVDRQISLTVGANYLAIINGSLLESLLCYNQSLGTREVTRSIFSPFSVLVYLWTLCLFSFFMGQK